MASSRKPEPEWLLPQTSSPLPGLVVTGVEMRARGREGTVIIRGAAKVAAQAIRAARPGSVTHPALVDSDPGILITAGGQPVTIVAFTVTDGAITAMRVLTDPDRLAHVVPSWAA